MSATVLYNNAVKQTHQLQQELAQLEIGRDHSAAIQGQINAGLASLQRCANDLDDFARREVTAAKKEKAIARAKKVREDYTAIHVAFTKWKTEERAKVAAQEREALLGSSSTHADRRTSSAVKHGSTDPRSADMSILMFDSMLKENQVLDASGNRMDEMLHMGQEALQELYQQRDTLKGAQRRLYDIANHLGLSTSVIKYIERRTTEDKWLFFGGVTITILVMWFIVHYLG
ncbi:snare region anchored in the vesicle membrane C-terminus-domain-containing protein [Powellomyces hirtus]|nr:snare region anchored in the vesicle membrane C-terminus-domain-containing protein [Powellomyces hirtus]